MSKDRDRALIERCRSGDRRALGELLGHYEKPVFNAAYRITGHPDDAADVTQSVFLKAFENLDRYDGQYKFFSWIYRMAVNESINLVSRAKPQQELDDSQPATDRGPEELAEAGALSRRVQAGLMTLKEDYRVVVVLKHISELSYRQISEILQIPEKTVKSRLYSARQLMKDELKSIGVL